MIIAAAGGAAHLAGVLAAHTTLPVIGIPIKGGALDGLDALLSTVQMPAGVPVATVALGKAGAVNAALLAVQMLALSRADLQKKLPSTRRRLKKKVDEGNKRLSAQRKAEEMKKTLCVLFDPDVCARGARLCAEDAAAAAPSNDVVQAVKEVVNVLQKYGLPFDAREARDAAVDAVIQAADPQGRLMSEADIAQMKEENKGILYEVGIRVALTNKAFVISEVRKDRPRRRPG